MNNKFKDIAKLLGLRGWSFHIERENRLFLSKFDPREKHNNDEYRVYFFLNPEGVQITRRFVIKKYKFDERVNLKAEKNKYIAEAESIINTYFEMHMKKNVNKAI